MSNILKRIRKSSLSVPKHEKLLEDPSAAEEPLVEGVTFQVKYLGRCSVENDSAEDETAAAIKDIITTAKKENSKLCRVSLTITEKGIKMIDITTKETKLEISIYNISFCTADPTFDHVFAFNCETSDGLECHAFLCPKKKMAKAATLTIAQGFSLAYQAWQDRQVKTKNENVIKKKESPMSNVIVTEAIVENVPQPDQNPEEVSENLLIDWNDDQSQQRTDNTENLKEFEDWKPKTSQWITFDESEVARMNDQFERLTLSNGPMQILHQLPADVSSLQFGAFACSPTLSDFTGSPYYGSSLSPSHLISPVGSPFPMHQMAGSPSGLMQSQPFATTGSPLRGSQFSHSK